jgi:CRP/FNR family transcriptional regulator, polysaccharide utilization system transcription regulator
MYDDNPDIEYCLEGPSSIFKGLNYNDKESLVQHHKTAIIKKGAFLFKEGEKVHGLVCLISGKVKIFKVGAGEREQILKMVKQMEFIGYRTLFSEKHWSFSAKAIEESVICILNNQILIKILKNNADLSLKLTKLLSDELWYLYNRVTSLTQKHVMGRLVETLLMLGDIYGFEDDGKTLQATLSREDIAHLSNMTTSNAIRTLSFLASEGSIELKGRKIKILSGNNLELICDQG